MLLSLNLINKYLNSNFLVEDVVNSFVDIGIQVENYYKIQRDYSNIRIGKVVFNEKHPNADKLFVCKVDFGNEILQILTADESVKVNDIVLVALKGAVLEVDGKKIVIDVRKMKGMESYGMMLSTNELNWNNVKAIGDKVAKFNFDYKISNSIGKYLKDVINEEDYIIEIQPFANRPDHLGFYHILKELSVKLNTNIIELPVIDVDNINNGNINFDIDIVTDKCRFYSGIVFDNIEILPSPIELQLLLNNIGIKPINNIVDITNFVMYELANPLHAFDFSLVGKKIVVKKAKDGQILAALDDKDYTLSDDDIIISNDNDEVLALGGVIGSRKHSVFDNTNSILLEVANFDPVSIRRTSKRLGIYTNSSKRFEKDLPVYYTLMAYKRASFLIKQSLPNSNIKLFISKPKKEDLQDFESFIGFKTIEIDLSKIKKHLGIEDLELSEVRNIFNNIGIIYESNNVFKVKTYRKDLNYWWDLAEEIAKIKGFDFFKNKALLNYKPYNYFNPTKEISLKLERDFRECFTNNGFVSVIGYNLLNSQYLKLFDEKFLELANPMSYNAYRNYVLASTLLIANYNYKQGYKNFRIFEIGHSYLDYEKTELAAVSVNNNTNSIFKDVKSYFIFNFQFLKNMIYHMLNRYGVSKNLIKFEKADYKFLTLSYDIFIQDNKIGFIGVINYLVNEYIEDGELPPYTICLNLNLSVIKDIILNFSKNNLLDTEKKVELIELPLIYRDLSLVIDKNYFDNNVLFNLKNELLKIQELFNKDKTKFKIVDFYLLDYYENLNSYTFRVVIKPFENLSSEYINEFLEKYIDILINNYSIKRR